MLPIKVILDGDRYERAQATPRLVHGVPLYGALIGLELEGEPVLGVVNLPA